MPPQVCADPISALVDARTGIVAELRPRPLPVPLPASLRLWAARMADSRYFSCWPTDPVTTGCAWSDDEQARMAALGEAVERYCGALVPPRLLRATAAELRARGRHVLDLTRLALFAPEQYQTPGFPFVPFEPELPVRWVTGRDMRTGAECAVPASLVYTTFHRGCPDGPYQDEPLTHPVPYAGLAAGRSAEQAQRAALLELVERDAVTHSWLCAEKWSELVVPDPLDELFRGAFGVLGVRLFAVPAAVDVPVLAALVEDTGTDLLALGTAARSDPRQAALKAVAEAAQLHVMLHDLDDPDSALMRLARTEPGCPLRPWRAERRYRDTYRSDWRDVRDLACHLQLYLDPAMRAALRERLDGLTSRSLNTVPASRYESAQDLVRAFVRAGIQPVAVDLTTSDVRHAGWCAWRVIAPGLYPNTPAAFPPLGDSRVAATAPEKQTFPLPYA